MDFFTALVFWLKKICISSLYLEASVLIFALTFRKLNSLKSQVFLHFSAPKKFTSLGASVDALGLTPTAATGNCLTLPGLESLEHLRAADPIGVEVRAGPFIEKLPISFVSHFTLHTSHFWGYI